MVNKKKQKIFLSMLLCQESIFWNITIPPGISFSALTLPSVQTPG